VREVRVGAGAGEGRIRKAGGGRKRLGEREPTVVRDLERLGDPVSRGEPESPVRWTRKSTYTLRAALRPPGPQLSQRRVSTLLQERGYPRQSNRKRDAGRSHPARQEQFDYS
jgi:hypothetical protein